MSMAPSSDIEDAEDADTDYVSHNEFPVTSQYPDLEYVPISPWPEGLPENAKVSHLFLYLCCTTICYVH